MDVVELERHAQRVAARLQIAGDRIVGVQLPPGFGRVGGASRAGRLADDAPKRRTACDVLRFLADAMGERVVLRVAGHVGERHDRDSRHAERGRRRRFLRGRDSRCGFDRRRYQAAPRR